MELLAWFGKLDVDALSCPSNQPDLRAHAKTFGFVGGDVEYNRLLREFAISLVRRQLKELTTAEQDLLQAVEALDDLNQSVNLLDERLYEWSRLHREDIVHGKDLAEALKDDKTMGDMARAILGLRESRLGLEKEVALKTACIAPNLSNLAGPVLAARLISRAGSLKHLSEMPSSAIQVMGAEKSLFKHLKGNAPSPKHGLIYRHPSISGAPKRLHGKIARALAGKLAIASRLDYYGAGPSTDLKASLDKRLAEIRELGRVKMVKP
ncbi:MAG: NOP5/NOP56 family protein [Methanotrichaceae archaeon]